MVVPSVGEAKSSKLEPTDTLPVHPVVCVVHSSAMVEVSYPQDGLCDAIILNKVFYHSGQVSVSHGENHTYQEFLSAAAKSKLTAYMLATDRYFAVYETIPAAPSLEALRKINVRGFGFLGIRVQSAQGALLEQHTRLLRSQVEATAAWMTESGIHPAQLHTAVAFSSWIPAMQFLRSADVTTETHNGTKRCFIFSLTPYDKLVCSQPRRYHNVSDMYFAKDEAMQGLYVYDDPAILKEKVLKVRRAMNGTGATVGWAFYGLEFDSEDAGECGQRYDRISAVKTVLRTLRA
ncbi:hypothetical protein MRX96_029853 [Rhipicephalus microplus]